MAKLFITGGAGFIGSNFILYWMKTHPDDFIINFDKLTYAGNLENLKDVEKKENYKFVKGDISDSNKVKDALKGVDVLVHFAAESHVDRSIIKPSDFVEANVSGTQVLLDAALKLGIKRFHHVSTDEVFGSLGLEDKSKFNERTRFSPRSPYSASKAGSDHLVKAYFHTYNLPVTISNCSNNYGPYQFPEKLIPLAITNLLDNKKIPIYGDGLYVRDWLYVEDHCKAIELILEKGKLGESYCIGGLTGDINNLEIIRKILKIMQKDEKYIEHVKDRPGHDRRYAVDWNKIKDELGWEPMHNFDEWILETVNWYKKNESWWRDVRSGDYKDYYERQYGNL